MSKPWDDDHKRAEALWRTAKDLSTEAIQAAVIPASVTAMRLLAHSTCEDGHCEPCRVVLVAHAALMGIPARNIDKE